MFQAGNPLPPKLIEGAVILKRFSRHRKITLLIHPYTSPPPYIHGYNLGAGVFVKCQVALCDSDYVSLSEDILEIHLAHCHQNLRFGG